MNDVEGVITGLDIGTSKVCAVIGEIIDGERISVAGVGMNPSKGLRKGAIVNLADTIKSIHSAIRSAEMMAGIEVEEVIVGIGGNYVKNYKNAGMITISRGINEFGEDDISRVIEAASVMPLPADVRVLDIIPQEYIIDGQQKGVVNPLGMNGTRLEVVVNIMTCQESFAVNIAKAVEKAGYEVRNIVLETLASSLAVLTPDEKELGVLLVDVGGGTTDCILFMEKRLEETFFVDLGGNHLTRDLAICLRTPLVSAEEYKIEHGAAWMDSVKSDDSIEVQRIGGRSLRLVEHEEVVKILESRMEEIFVMVKRKIQKLDMMDSLAAGIVLTGGAVKLEGTLDLAEEVFGLPVRLGIPDSVEGVRDVLNDPQYSTGVGLVIYGMEIDGGMDYYDRIRRNGDYLMKIWKAIVRFFKDLF